MKAIALLLWILITLCALALMATALFVHTTNPFSWTVGLLTFGFSLYWWRSEIRHFL